METLFDLNEIDDEYKAFQAILPDLQKIIDKNYAPEDGLKFQKNANCSSVYFYKTMLFRICIRKKQSFFSFVTKKPELFSDMSLYQIKSEKNNNIYRCKISKPEDITQYSKQLCLILDKAIDNQPKEVDICDLYQECSTAKKCVHPKREFSMTCGYKRVLKSGKIFYGVNRNVD